MQCEMCGKDLEAPIKARIEGVEMRVCQYCVRYGQVITQSAPPRRIQPKPLQQTRDEYSEELVTDHAARIRNAIPEIKEASRMLGIKESALSAYRSGSIRPPIEDARKIERAYGIKLVERVLLSDKNPYTVKETGSLRIGDTIKIKKRK